MIRIFSQYVSPKSLLLVILEAGLISLGLLCGVRLRFWDRPVEFESYVQAPEFTYQALIFVVTMLTCFYYTDLYDLNAFRDRREQLICLGQSFGAACLLLGLLYFIFPILLIGRGVFFISTTLVATFVSITRLSLDLAWQIAAPKQNILVLGSEDLALTVVRELVRRDDLNIQVAGFVKSAAEASESAGLSGRPVLGTMEDLVHIVETNHISRIIVAMEDRRGSLPIRDLVRLRVMGIRVEDAHSTVSSLTGRIWLNMVRPSWFVFTDGFHRSRLTPVWKRIIDLAVGLLGLLLASPLMMLVALAVRLESSGPVFFSQTRVGFKGKPFEVLKFRSMRVDAEAQTGAQWATKNDPRITHVGRYLRKFRLDELPQLLNVIRGEMSFVGPRPERPVFVERLRNAISYYDERHSVRPGLTGWAQVQYTYGASTEDAFRKLEYDLFYLKNMSLIFDCVVILKTIRIVLSGKGGW
jgi:sugar transferase (PEP-CTERM system associated)